MPRRLALYAMLAAAAACGKPAPSAPARPPSIAGAERIGLTGAALGRVLLEELGCTACHAGATPERARPPRGPDLTHIAARVRPDYLVAFLRDPHATEPGTPMPDLPGLRDDGERQATATAIAAWLGSLGGEAAAEPFDDAAAARGKQLYHAIGCVACHAPHDDAGREQPSPHTTPMAPLAAKYSRVALREFLLAPHRARPAGRMPDLHLTPAQARDLAHFLVRQTGPPAAIPASAALVATGRSRFEQANCAACHAHPDTTAAPKRPARPLAALDGNAGCLSGARGAWPYYPLHDTQRSALRAALAEPAPKDQDARVRELLAARDCLACHERGERTIEDTRFFGTDDPGLGPEARMPPTLTDVGAKLQPDWLHETIAHGQRERPYMHTRMPGFGSDFAKELAALLTTVDTLPPVAVRALPADDDGARKERDLGRELVGDKGMNCITCHRFAGAQAGSMGAIDLVESTGRRLRPEWFAHFLRTPFRFKPATLMPQFFPDGISTRPELGGGDTDRQIAAMWHYLAEGRNVQSPSGMRRPPIELTVGDEAVILRRSLQDTGKRAIAVGLPGGINLAFDAERLAIQQIWWGRFVDAAPVWTSQGSGQARILGDRRVRLPDGPTIVQLPAATAPWPTASRRELGHRWLGYDLDAQQRPTFRYAIGDFEITEAVREGGDTSPTLRRSIRVQGNPDADLWLLAARDARVEAVGDGAFRAGDHLRLTIRGATADLVDREGMRELRIPLAVRQGVATVEIDYAWHEERK
ncbi:MAG: c-type cytochrome [Planctomycetes bacterium]|nr:c-type cytochrome [Planctomycetota bacterium]